MFVTGWLNVWQKFPSLESHASCLSTCLRSLKVWQCCHKLQRQSAVSHSLSSDLLESATIQKLCRLSAFPQRDTGRGVNWRITKGKGATVETSTALYTFYSCKIQCVSVLALSTTLKWTRQWKMHCDCSVCSPLCISLHMYFHSLERISS